MESKLWRPDDWERIVKERYPDVDRDLEEKRCADEFEAGADALLNAILADLRIVVKKQDELHSLIDKLDLTQSRYIGTSRHKKTKLNNSPQFHKEALALVKEFCPNCEEYTEVILKIEKETYDVRGEGAITIESELALCQKCGNKVFNEVRDTRNLDKAYAIYQASPSRLHRENK